MPGAEPAAPGVRIHPAGEGAYRVEGPLDFATVPALWRDATLEPGAGGRVEVDLAGVTRADSAGLALLLEWLRAARGRGLAVAFRNPPAQMLAVARAARLESLLG